MPIELRLDDGTCLRGQLWEGGPGWTLVLHEPGPEHDLDDWRELVPYLLGAGTGVVALDLRGHGASDGDWSAATDAIDIASAVTWLRARAGEGGPVTVVAAGASAVAAVAAAELERPAGLVLVSPGDRGETVPRGAGVPKLILASAGAPAPGGTRAADRLRAASIGPALTVSVPSAATGAGLFASDVALTCREHLLAFLRERLLEHRYGGADPAPAPDLFLQRLGIEPKGVER